MKKIIVNGSIFATGKKDGIPRYATEIIKELDRLKGSLNFEVVTPVPLSFHLDKIAISVIKPEQYASGKFGAELWKQVAFVNYANKDDSITLDLGMMLPFKRNDVCAIFDCQPEKYRENYINGIMSRCINNVRLAQRKHAAKTAKAIITDSQDAKEEIVHFLNADSKRIHVVYCAWQHFDAIQPDESVFDKYPELSSSPYFFSLGSRYKHKNIEWVFAAARQNPQYRFAITGYNDVASYSESIVHSAPDNVIFTGYLPDAQIKALMMRCRAFIHPSFSEGFGIPPLEALSVGCEIIVSNASCLPEIYEIYAHYIDPEKYDDICLDDILNPPIENRQELLKKYSWAKSAEKIYRLLETIAEEDT